MSQPIDTTYEKSTRDSLELDSICQLLTRHTCTEIAKERLLHAPSLNLQEGMAHFNRMSTWMDFLEHSDPLAIPSIPDRRWWDRNPFEYPLDREELRSLLTFLTFWNTLLQNEGFTNMIPIDQALSEEDLQACRQLQRGLAHAFQPNGDWSEDVTPQYAKLCKEEQRVHKRIDSILREKLTNYSDQLSEQVIFERNGRKVLAVQNTYKRKIPGILQDYSTSGQTAFIEPDTSTPLQNRIQEIYFEKKEILFKFRVALTSRIQSMRFLDQNLANQICQLDMQQALALAARETECHFIQPNTEGNLALYNARHPFLDERFATAREACFDKVDKNRMVALTFGLEPGQKGFIISGANAGGKTVSIKTIGVTAWLANHGFPVPCDPESEIPFYQHIFVDIGDHQSLSHNLSTYASHLKAMKHILEFRNEPGLVLLDELGSGTDPQEGNALAQALIETMLEGRVHLFVTTHQQVLCSFALTEERLGNASMSFDKHRLLPTYHFIQGVPGRSHAIEIAERTGFPAEVLQRAKSLMDDNQMDVQAAIIRLQDQSKALEKQRAKARKEERRAQRRIVETKKEKSEFEALQAKLKEKEQKRIESTVKKVEKEFRALLKDVESRKSRQKLVQAFSAKQREMVEPKPEESKNRPQPSGLNQNQWNSGDRVFLSSWNQEATLISLDRKNARVDLNGMTMSVQVRDLIHLEQKAGKDDSDGKKIHIYADESVSHSLPFEIKLLGLTREEALEELQKTIDAAMVQHPAMLKVVHGHGHGILKRAVREFLNTHPFRSHWECKTDPENDGTTDLHFRW